MLFQKFKAKKNEKNQTKESIYESAEDNLEDDEYGLMDIPSVKSEEKNQKKKPTIYQKVQKTIQLAKGKKLRTTLFWSFFVFAIGGYIFFFYSQEIFPGGINYLFTPTNQNIKMADSSLIKIVRWDYSPTQKIAEIELEINDITFESTGQYNIACYVKIKNEEKKVKTKAIVQETDYFVVQMEAPDHWGELIFYVQIADEKYSDKITKLHANQESITTVEQISAKTKEGYLQNRMLLVIQDYRTKIESLEKENESLKNKIANIRNKNQELEDNKKYQTSVQITDTTTTIERNNDLIKSTEKTISDNKRTITEYDNLITQTERKYQESLNQE